MTVSIWRYSHLLLALVSSLFLVLASVTGIILAFEPITEAAKPYKPIPLEEVTISETMEALQRTYNEVLFVELDPNDFVIASVVDQNGDSQTRIVHPKTGAALGTPERQAPLFQFATNLHRSLFLKSIGRFFVGLVSFLLCLIAVTGLLLIIKRQGGLKKLFSKVQNDYFEIRYHVVLGRWFLVPILIIAATGVYLSAEKFSLLPPTTVLHDMTEPQVDVDLSQVPFELPFFKETRLSKVRSITFPFSEMPEDYFEVALKDRELYIHQYTGEILSEAYYPFTALASRWSLSLHTGQGSIGWSLILLLASISILFFIYSGFVMWQKRTKNKPGALAQVDKDEATHIVLVGSETGHTFRYAQQLATALDLAGKSVFMTELNRFSSYPNAERLIILTSTYGDGEAPTNARKFQKELRNFQPKRTLKYAVLGFGSLRYPNYCAYAQEVAEQLGKSTGFKAELPLYKINNQDDGAFLEWVTEWSGQTGIPLQLQLTEKTKKAVRPQAFTVVERTPLNEDDTFLIRLRSKKRIRFESGDLAGITPEDGVPRQYSIARVENDMLLSVKRHAHGICSPYLSQLEPGETMSIGIEANTAFHFPSDTSPVLFIANGTGIAPFLGMLHGNHQKAKTHLFLGLRTRKSMELYTELLSEVSQDKKLSSIQIAYSQEGQRYYVQDLIRENPELVSNHLKDGGLIYICGSLDMQEAVLDVLESIALKELDTPLSQFEHKNQLKMDCY